MPKGGAREGAGRPSRAAEAKASSVILNAIKALYQLEDDDEAKSKFITDHLIGSQRGNLFLAEHLFGKPKETIDNNHTFNNFSIKDVLTFKKTEIDNP